MSLPSPGALAEATRDEARLRDFLHRLPTVDDDAVERRATAEASGATPSPAMLDSAIGMIDLTSLAATDTATTVRALCGRAQHPDPGSPEVPTVAAVCVFPDLVETAAAELADSGIGIASVAGGFPSGRTFRAVKRAEIEHATSAGATEIDTVLDRGAFLEGNYGAAFDDIVAAKQACGQARLKVILETGELGSAGQVRRACWLALLAGADFLKTSTGKSMPAATLSATYLLAETVRDWYAVTGQERGIKPAGGIRTTEDAVGHLAVAERVAGSRWPRAGLFRIGASSVLDDLVSRRRTLGDGRGASC
ncbi:deoxyribose-phosphate aldolase [Haloechinothrix sp. LS1_15]|uniref:deoxyribose-phosphate aldolase n=1 Tax=Haloechinothrix sp. LS1_15 TaxID=2652248 RepID=UPI00294B721E|nr:deoxyribose-phosphate aldolase [Haloechinothrix sp. LS1_15]